MINFKKWIENKDNNALSPPQHKANEKNKSLDDAVSIKLMKLALEVESEGKGSRQDVLKSIERVIGKQQQSQNTNVNSDSDGSDSETPPEMTNMQQPMMQQPMMQQPMMQQPMQQPNQKNHPLA